MSAEFDFPLDHPIELDALVQATMRWHFGAQTGSPFWLRQAEQLGFDPIRDIRSVADLCRFPDVSGALREAAAADLIPRGCARDGWAFQVFESGGTTGSPKRIIEMDSRRRGVEWVSNMLAQHGFPGEGGGSWLHIGPTGPHIVGRSIGLLAQMRKSLCYYIDFDPRWVKRCLSEGARRDAARYLNHIIDQAEEVLKSQPISVIFVTPPVLEAVCARPRILELFRRRARALLWAGTSFSAESLRLITEHYFPQARVVGLYGNTLMGIACQRLPQPGDTQPCVFQPFHPYCLLDVVAPEQPDVPVPYGAEGQVQFTLLTREIFLPGVRERDAAIRVPPCGPYSAVGVAQVKPLASGGDAVFEGVY